MTIKIYRLIDANYNRLKEALRLLEDIARFVLDNKKLSYGFKTLRHSLAPLYEFEYLKHRDIIKDVGKESTKSEFERGSLEALIMANFSRAQEAARTLEEAFKLTDKKKAQRVKEIRYELYNLQKIFMESL